MINQFGVKGFNLVNGAFEFYEITVNGEYKGTVKRANSDNFPTSWIWVNYAGISSMFYDCEHSAIVSLKEHLNSIPAKEHSVECQKEWNL